MAFARALPHLPSRPAARVALVAIVIAALVLGALGAARLIAQVEGERGIAPVASNGDFEVTGIAVETTGDDAEDARVKGWKEAQRLGWERLWAETGHDGKPPQL
ncbi:MAG: heavy-metal-associated domain-containing protein, partial [Novosphingobium sp.]